MVFVTQPEDATVVEGGDATFVWYDVHTIGPGDMYTYDCIHFHSVFIRCIDLLC